MGFHELEILAEEIERRGRQQSSFTAPDPEAAGPIAMR
jgi:hypothetical protein